MNYRSIESKIVTAKALKDKATINEIYIDLSNQKIKLDRWFDKFLDMFDEKLSHCNSSDPVKKLYNTKFEEYSKVARALKLAESYLKG
jgi:hypothetical protein